VLHAQGYASRARRGTAAEVEATIQRLSCGQLDSISAVERSPRVVPPSPVGASARETVSKLLGRGRLFEYWAHEACLLPVEDWPLFRAAMANGGRRWYGDIERTHPELAGGLVPGLRGGGPLGSRHFEGSAEAGMWNWKPAK